MNDIEKAIEVLKMENELMQFNPMTGEIEPIELQNQDNQDLYKANLVAIKALTKQQKIKECLEWLKTLNENEKLIVGELIEIMESFIKEVENE
jgi:hypothetical protein